MKKPKYSSQLSYDLARLDWILILHNAIESRPTSWGERPVVEWRNASDEVWSALMRAMREARLIPDFFEDITPKP